MASSREISCSSKIIFPKADPARSNGTTRSLSLAGTTAHLTKKMTVRMGRMVNIAIETRQDCMPLNLLTKKTAP